VIIPGRHFQLVYWQIQAAGPSLFRIRLKCHYNTFIQSDFSYESVVVAFAELIMINCRCKDSRKSWLEFLIAFAIRTLYQSSINARDFVNSKPEFSKPLKRILFVLSMHPCLKNDPSLWRLGPFCTFEMSQFFL